MTRDLQNVDHYWDMPIEIFFSVTNGENKCRLQIFQTLMKNDPSRLPYNFNATC